jgi:D-inositol-3-phosphate glycosyltransferase
MYHTLGAVKNAVGIGENEPRLRVVSEADTVADCQRIIVATQKEKRDLITYYNADPEKTGVVPCGVNMEMFRPIQKTFARQTLGWQNEKILLFVGRIDSLKGIEQLLKAMPFINSRDKVRLVVVGGDEHSRTELDGLEKLAAKLDIKDRVRFEGSVKQARLPYYYSGADVCVVPSYYESFGLVALEALACGTPVVASDVGDLRNIIRPGESGYVVEDNSPEKLAQGINLVFAKIKTDRESILAIRASVAGLNWAEIAGRVAGEMQMVVSGRLTPVA